MNRFKQSLLTVFVFLSVVSISCKTGDHAGDEADARAAAMLARMTLDEKTGQMSQLFDDYFSDSEKFKTSHS